MVTPRAGAPKGRRPGAPAPAASPAALEAALRGGAEGAAPPFVLAAGPSEYRRERIVAAFRAGAAAEGAEFQRLEGDELEPGTLAGALESLSLFASSRRIWIREGAKLGTACEEMLLAWAAAPAPGLSILLTTARDPSELKFLGALAERAATVSCVERPSDARREAERMAAEAGLKLPAGALEALASRSGSLLALSREMEKLGAVADASGALPARAFDAVAGGRAAASVDRWAAAVLTGDVATARSESNALEAEGSSGGNALWAVASLALAGLEPQAFAYRRGPAGPALRPERARAALDAVYRADRAMKRGEIRDTEIRDVLERGLAGGTGVRTT
jgi:DNA polymerase III delta subunit